MRKIVRYGMAWSNDPGDFCDKINNLINKGFQPHGSVFTTINQNGKTICHQPMVLYEPEITQPKNNQRMIRVEEKEKHEEEML